MSNGLEIIGRLAYTSTMKHDFFVTTDGVKQTSIRTDAKSTLAEAAAELGIQNAICALVGGKPVSLNNEVEQNAIVQFLRPDESEQAARVFLRGATFLLHCAVKALYPKRWLIVDHVLGGGVFCRMDGVSKSDIQKLQDKIDEYIAKDECFSHHVTDVGNAQEILRGEGLKQQARLLEFRPYDDFNLYGFDGHQAYFHGIMPPSAGYLRGTRLTAFEGGFVLKYTAPYRQAQTKLEDHHGIAEAFEQAERWASAMNASYIADINERYMNGEIEDLITLNEQLHEKKIEEIARVIINRGARVVLIAGPSSSGKTTFSRRMAKRLLELGKKSLPISVDDYYKNREDVPRDENGEYDFECMEALDVAKLGQDLDTLLAGNTAELPEFDFVNGRRKQETVPTRIDDEVLILEGIHALNDKLTPDVENGIKFKIYVSPLTALNFDERSVVLPSDLRLLRRLARDQRTRGYSFAQTFDIWDSVREGEFKYILPTMAAADTVFNTTLLYEPLVLKRYCYEGLQTISPDEKCYAQAQSLLKFLNYFLLCDARAVPTKSILREFIGSNG